MTPRCKPAVTKTCTVPVSWNSERNAGGSAARSPHSSPARSDAAGSPSPSRSRACAHSCARASQTCALGGDWAPAERIAAAASRPFRPRSASMSRWLGSPGLRASSNGSSLPRNSTRVPGGGAGSLARARTRGPLSSATVSSVEPSPLLARSKIVPAYRAVRCSVISASRRWWSSPFNAAPTRASTSSARNRGGPHRSEEA
jgi:hypothetical protein